MNDVCTGHQQKDRTIPSATPKTAGLVWEPLPPTFLSVPESQDILPGDVTPQPKGSPKIWLAPSSCRLGQMLSLGYARSAEYTAWAGPASPERAGSSRAFHYDTLRMLRTMIVKIPLFLFSRVSGQRWVDERGRSEGADTSTTDEAAHAGAH